MTSILATVAIPACLAYVGPGPGVTMIGALIGLVLTVLGALVAISLWPIRVWRRRVAERRASRLEQTSETATSNDAPAGPTSRP